MKKQPLVSVITTVYNTEKYVERCFESIMEQTYPNIEFIIVNNASSGNIEKIVKDLKGTYPQNNIKIVNLKENVGLFHGRLAGTSVATGDYIAFIDSDDRVSLDFYRTLVDLALDTGADMAASDVVLEFSDGRMVYENLVPFHFIENLDLSGEEVAQTFWQQEGSCYYWHLVWNKIYSRELFERALPLLSMLEGKIVMCDDMAYSTVFYSLSNHLVSSNRCQYYYYKRADAYTSNIPNPDLIRNNVDNIIDVFNYMAMMLKKFGLEKYSINLQRWKKSMFRVWCRNIKDSKLSTYQQKLLDKYLLQAFNFKYIEYPSRDDRFFYQCQSPYTPFDDFITKEILNKEIEYVSFDIFDTLLIRPFWEPSDLFLFMNDAFQAEVNTMLQIDFCSIRQTAEREARGIICTNFGYEEVTIDEIYETMAKLFRLPNDICERMKALEISLEKRFCAARKYAFHIYRMALEAGKKIICVSDMYLPQKTIWELLNKNGYTQVESVFVSSEFRLTKHNGTLYKEVLKTLDISARHIVHIGDNGYSDYEVPKKIGLHTIHIPKSKDVWGTYDSSCHSGNYYTKCFYNNTVLSGFSAMEFLGNRCVQGVIANRIHNNPFSNPNASSDFNANSYDMGYALLGPYLLALTRWLQSHVQENGYNCIHFIARDGFLLKEAFTLLQPYLGNIKTNYLLISRKAAMPLMIQNPYDMLTLDTALNYVEVSPKIIINLLKPIIIPCIYQNAKIICEKNKFIYDQKFTNYTGYIRFLHLLADKFYNQEHINLYRLKMKAYFEKIIGTNDCCFDIGYSGRTESLLMNLLGYSTDAYYLHTNKQVAIDNARINNFKVTTFLDYGPILPGPIREMLFSSLEPSCVGYDIIQENVVPIFEDKPKEFLQNFSIGCLQKGALDFIRDMRNQFAEDTMKMSYRNFDLAWPLEYFFSHATPMDLTVFNGSKFEDNLFLGNTVLAGDYWLQSRNTSAQFYNAPLYEGCPKWKKFIYLFMFDRKMLKEKVKHKLDGHPILFGLAQFSYSACRAIYHIFRK